MSLPETALFEQECIILKISLIIVATVMSLVIALLVFRFKRVIERMKKAHLANHMIVQKRTDAFETIGPKLYDMISFYCYSGSWKEIGPIDVMRLKRELDKDIGSKSPLFSHSLIEKFNAFIQLCFVSTTGWEHKEKIKSLYQLRKENNEEWSDEWIEFFDTKNVVDAIRLRDTYNELMLSFKKDIHLE